MSHAWRDVGWVVAARAVVSVIVLASGFLAVSDDDYARVVIAQRWAEAPRLDPSGTSWLPLPLWVHGSVMALVGSGLPVARATAVASGLGSAVLLAVAARWIWAEDDPRAARSAAVIGAGLACCLPTAARLGVATVPELPTVALTMVALGSLVGPPVKWRRVWGACAVLVASLSRYEPWAIAPLLAAWSATEALRSRGADRARSVLAAALAAAGPAAWILCNRVAHGDALAFAERVSAYRRAIGEGGSDAQTVAWHYGASLVRAEPELFVLCAALVALGWAQRAVLRPLLRPAALVGVMVVALVVAGARDGAPTHHLERALLVVTVLAAFAVARLAHATTRRRAAAAVVAATLLGAWARSSAPAQDYAHRQSEETIGRLARRGLASASVPDRVLVEVTDYGYLAIVAGFGRPDRVVLDREIDPREPQPSSSFAAIDALRARLDASGASAVVARRTAVTRSLGEPVARAGEWSLWRVTP